MGMRLKNSSHTYSQFTDLVFRPLPQGKDSGRLLTIIDNHEPSAFTPFMDDHAVAENDFDQLLTFLHCQYFPRLTFGPIYLNLWKTVAFAKSLEIVGFEGNRKGLRPSIKHHQKIVNWPVPQNHEELDAFL